MTPHDTPISNAIKWLTALWWFTGGEPACSASRMGCSASAVPIEDGYVFRIADPPAMPANSRAAERERERSMNAGGAAKLGGKSEFGAKKWAGVRNTVKGANAFEQSGFRRAAREKSRSSEHGWLAKVRPPRPPRPPRPRPPPRSMHCVAAYQMGRLRCRFIARHRERTNNGGQTRRLAALIGGGVIVRARCGMFDVFDATALRRTSRSDPACRRPSSRWAASSGRV